MSYTFPLKALNEKTGRDDYRPVFMMKSSLLLQLLDLDVFPRNREWAFVFTDAVNLETEEAFGVRFETDRIVEVGNRVAIDPDLDAGAFGDDTVVVP